jgi:hypothetical protein
MANRNPTTTMFGLPNLDYLGLTKFDLYHNNYTGLHTEYRYRWSLPFEKLDDPIAVTHIFQQIWFLSIPLSFWYYVGIKWIQAKMRNRPAYQLNTQLFYWNASLALFSAIALIRFSEDFFYTWKDYGFTYTVSLIQGDNFLCERNFRSVEPVIQMMSLHFGRSLSDFPKSWNWETLFLLF